MVRNKWKNGDGMKTGFQREKLKLGTLKLGNHDFYFLLSQFLLFLRPSSTPTLQAPR